MHFGCKYKGIRDVFPANRKVDLVTRESKHSEATKTHLKILYICNESAIFFDAKSITPHTSKQFQAIPSSSKRLELLGIAWNCLELCGVIEFASKNTALSLQI